MAQRTLKRMALEPICWDALQRKNMTVSRDVLVCTKTELVQQLDVSSDVVENMIDKICKATCPEVRTVNVMCLADAPERFLPTGLDSLDDALHGGLPCASICEVVGPAGAGKTPSHGVANISRKPALTTESLRRQNSILLKSMHPGHARRRMQYLHRFCRNLLPQSLPLSHHALPAIVFDGRA
jgi:hypothetical protein